MKLGRSVVVACWLWGCQPAAPVTSQQPKATTAPAGAVSSAAREAPSEPPPAAKGSERAEPAPKPERFAGSQFPPAAILPPHPRSAQPDDGRWQALGSDQERVFVDPPLMVRTLIHPHKVSKWQKLTVVAIDQRRVRVAYVPGSSDVEDAAKLSGNKADAAVESGLVPAAAHERLLVVFNGGFKPRHGRWGMKVGGTTLLPPREQGCTVAIDREGSVLVRPWPSLAAEADQFDSYRQTPPCLLEAGELHEKLAAFNERPWGGFDPKRKTRRRSALGVDVSGRTLFYGIAEEVGPRVLAEGMRYAGAHFAAELDINWSWTRFLMFGQSTTKPGLKVTSTLIPEMVHQDRQYVENTSARGFFYVTGR